MGKLSALDVISKVFALKRGKFQNIVKLDRNIQYVVEFDESESEIDLYLVSKAASGCPATLFLRPRGRPRTALETTRIYRDEEIVLHKLTVARKDLTEQSRIFARRDNAWHRTVRPYHTGVELPPGWGFSAYHLYLEYEPPKPQGPQLRSFIQYVEKEEDAIVVKAVLISNVEIATAVLGIRKFRDEAQVWMAPVELRKAGRVFWQPASVYRIYRGEFAYRFDVRLPIDWSSLPSSLYSLTLHCDGLATGLHAFNAKFALRQKPIAIDGVVVNPYIDRASATLRFERLAIDEGQWRALASYAARSTRRDVCLFGEYTNAARDNAAHLFKHARESDRAVAPSSHRIRPRYVIEAASRDEIDGEGVLDFGSFEHLKACVDCGAVVFTHHPSYVWPSFVDTLRRDYPKTVFLQHGVTALKKSMGAYAASRQVFDVFAVCSPREAGFVIKACGYAPGRVRSLGFPRFDRLTRLARARPERGGNILVFPTWRPRLDRMTTEEFAASDFCANWRAGVAALRELADETGARVQLMAHPIIGRHAGLLAPGAHETVGVEYVQEALVEAACVVTDYSSIAFDALYIGRPTAFFTFDSSEYQFGENAFIDVERDLPGPQASTPEELGRAVRAILGGEAAAAAALDQARRAYFQKVDDLNCDRLLEAVAECLEAAAASVPQPAEAAEALAAQTEDAEVEEAAG